MAYVDLDYTLRPLQVWHGDDVTPFGSRFRLTQARAERFMLEEIHRIGGRDVVLELDVTDKHFRVNGTLRADARPDTPRVQVFFELDGQTMRFSAGQYTDVASNLQAIGKTIQALRGIDRWGATKGGQQYTGWAALPPGGDLAATLTTPPPMDAKAAVTLLVRLGSGDSADQMSYHRAWIDHAVREIQRAQRGTGRLSRDTLNTLMQYYRQALKTNHPDHGGDGDSIPLIKQARDVIARARSAFADREQK